MGRDHPVAWVNTASISDPDGRGAPRVVMTSSDNGEVTVEETH